MTTSRGYQWALVVHFSDGESRYYAPSSSRDFTKYRGSATRYDTEQSALYDGYMLKERMPRIVGVEAEEVNPFSTAPWKVQP